MVFCVIRDPQTAVGRRLDLVASRRSEFPFALLAWSGNAIFERQLREYAKEVRLLNILGTCLFSRVTPNSGVWLGQGLGVRWTWALEEGESFGVRYRDDGHHD